jgi:hypothetical protein
MSNLTENFSIISINNISIQVNRYITVFVFLFGTIGNLLNITVLSQPVLRLNPCALYFLTSSIAGCGIILIGLPSRIIAGWISNDPTNTISWLCKFRIYVLYSCRTISVWLLVFATIDRWFSSSTKIHRRRLSSYKNACYSIFIISILALILWIQILICYDANLTNTPIKCYGKTNACRIFNDVLYASSTVAIPSLLMLIMGLLTIQNISRSNKAVRPFVITITMISEGNRRKRRAKRRRESSLTRMLLLQVLLLTICSIPQAAHQFYLSFTIDIPKDAYRLTIENFIVNLDFSLTYIGNGISFYIYTLNGTIFRQTLIRLIHLSITKVKLYLTFIFTVC